MLFGCCILSKDYHLAESWGFDYVEFSGAELSGLSSAEFDRLRGTVRAGKTPCLFLNSYCRAAPAIVGPAFQEDSARIYAERLCERAGALGVRMIGIGAPKARRLPPGFDEALADRQCQLFLEITAETAARYGIRINLEPLNPHACEYWLPTERALALAARARCDLGLVIDFYHQALAGESLASLSGAERLIRHTHISTCGPDLERGYPGRKDLSGCREILAGLKAAGYSGAMSVEAAPGDFALCGQETLAMLRLADWETEDRL